jgi:hypothetical protein
LPALVTAFDVVAGPIAQSNLGSLTLTCLKSFFHLSFQYLLQRLFHYRLEQIPILAPRFAKLFAPSALSCFRVIFVLSFLHRQVNVKRLSLTHLLLQIL